VVQFVHDRETDPAPVVAASAAASWTQSLAARARGSRVSQAARTSWARLALGRPYVWDGIQDGRPDSEDTGQDEVAQVAGAEQMAGTRDQESSGRADPLTCAAPGTERAVIGDHLRQPVVWCQVGTCIARHTDATALGEADIRSKAEASGWCLDAFGRLVCPSCQQLYPVWSARPPAPRARGRTRQARATTFVVGQHRRTY
jgi:hypothetical protein